MERNFPKSKITKKGELALNYRNFSERYVRFPQPFDRNGLHIAHIYKGERGFTH